MDLTLPGYNYLGPGNSLDKGFPTNDSDEAARLHDIEYQKYIDAGLNPYVNYNDADEAAILNFQSDWGGLIGKHVFKAKRILAKLGVIGHISLPNSNRNMDPNDLPPPKRQRTDDNPITIVTVPRGAINRPIVSRGAIRKNGARRTSFRRKYGSRRFGGYRRRYRRSYRRRY